MGNPFLGVFLHWCGGLASGSFYVPYKGVKKWSWETYWLVGGFFSWIICPWLFAYFMTNDLFGVLKQQSMGTLFWTYFFGMLWGFGGLTYGLTMRFLGLSLGTGVALGYCAAFGTLVPPIFKYFKPDYFVFANSPSIVDIAQSTSGQVTLAGVAVCLFGIAIAALAGFTKEQEMPAEQKQKSIKEFSFKKGIAVATFCGIMSACFAFALQAGKDINAASLAAGTNKIWTGLPALPVLLLGGFTTNFIWCVLLNIKNFRSGHRLENSCAAELSFLRARRHDVVFPVFLLHDGRDADGQIRFRFVDAAYVQHHHFRDDVGLDFPRMERLQQKGAPAHWRRHRHARSRDDNHRLRRLVEEPRRIIECSATPSR